VLVVVFGEKDVFVDQRTIVFVILVRTKCFSSFLLVFPRFENSRNVEMRATRFIGSRSGAGLLKLGLNSGALRQE
jgi:hypothetical protein